MAKNSVSDWSATAGENTDIAGIDINENCAPGNMNDMGRNIMSQIAALNIGDFGSLTATITELNYSAGVTSSIQSQLNILSNGKQPLDDTLTALAELSTGASKIPYSTGADVFDQLNFLDEDDMSSDDPLGVPSQQSVKAYSDSGRAFQLVGSWDHSSNVSVVDFTNLGDYESLTVVSWGVQNSAGAQTGGLRVSTNNGSSFVTSGYDSYGFDDASGDSYTDRISLGQSGTICNFVRVDMFNFNKSEETFSSGRAAQQKNWGVAPSGVNNAIRLFHNSGNFTAGHIRVYGTKG